MLRVRQPVRIIGHADEGAWRHHNIIAAILGLGREDGGHKFTTLALQAASGCSFLGRIPSGVLGGREPGVMQRLVTSLFAAVKEEVDVWQTHNR